jgi:hypothetical protein
MKIYQVKQSNTVLLHGDSPGQRHVLLRCLSRPSTVRNHSSGYPKLHHRWRNVVTGGKQIIITLSHTLIELSKFVDVMQERPDDERWMNRDDVPLW